MFVSGGYIPVSDIEENGDAVFAAVRYFDLVSMPSTVHSIPLTNHPFCVIHTKVLEVTIEPWYIK